MGGGGGRGGGGGGGFRGVDEDAQRKLNAEAPKVDNLLRRVGELFTPYKGQLVMTVLLVFLGAAIAVVPPLIVQRVFDDALFPIGDGGQLQPVNMRLLIILISIIFGLTLLSTGLGIAQTYFTSSVGNSVTGDLRVKLFEHLQRMELAFFTRTKTGVIQSRLQNDVGGVSGVLTNTLTSILGNVVTVIASLVTMIILDWRLTLIAIILLPILIWVQRKVGQRRVKIAAATQESLSELTAITQESLSVSGVMLSKSFNRQRIDSEKYRNQNAVQIKLQVKRAMSGQGFFAVVSVIMASIPAVIYLVAGILMGRGSDAVTAGTIVAFTTVLSRVLQPMTSLMRVALDVQTSQALFARIFEYLDMTPLISDAPDAIAVSEARGTLGHIEFKDVVFRYPDAVPDSRPTLGGISFAAEPGQHIAFVGPSGAGKTTVLYLTPRLYEAEAGTVFFAGEDVRHLIGESIIDHVGIVSQETYLFHATIAENLRYAKPDATDAELIEACKGANIHHIIETFEDGYDTVVGERGYRLSGGEKQRLAIARVMLKNPPVLLLDEATSALDTVSERVVQEALEKASKGRTTFSIAHRLSTIRDADVINVLVKGEIVESGSHDELLALDGVYADLIAEQLSD